jgi:beta-lactamase regulating signal transducer with metallopeptidase domain
MIQFNFDLLNSVQNYLLCGAGIWIALAIIKRSDPHALHKPIFWKGLFLVNLIAILPVSIVLLTENNLAFPSNWLNPMTEHLTAQVLSDDISINEATINWKPMVVWIYLAGLIGFVLRLAVKLRLLQQFIASSTPYPMQSNATYDVFTNEQRAFIEKHHINIRICSKPISPFAFGLLQKTIILPAYLFQLPPRKVHLLIAHELCHLKHKDPSSLLTTHLLCCLFWFNPMNWYYLKHMNLAMEFRVDNEIAKRTSVEPKLYAQTLLDVMKHSNIALPTAMMTPSIDTEQKSQIKQRITTIMSQTKISKRKHVKSLACWSLMMLSWPLVMLSVEAESGNSKPWQYPLETSVYKITSKFNAVQKIRNYKPHLGVDFRAALGTNIIAPAPGRVLIADDTTLHRNYGKIVVILHENGLKSFYAHMRDFNVSVGDTVQAGDILGQVGVTGKTTGPHLHMEVVLDHTHLDPMNFIDFIP